MKPEEFKRWVEEAKPGDKIAYYVSDQPRTQYSAKRKFHIAQVALAEHKVILYQKHFKDDDRIFYVAERVSDRALAWLERMENWHAPETKADYAAVQCAGLIHPTLSVGPARSYADEY